MPVFLAHFEERTQRTKNSVKLAIVLLDSIQYPPLQYNIIGRALRTVKSEGEVEVLKLRYSFSSCLELHAFPLPTLKSRVSRVQTRANSLRLCCDFKSGRICTKRELEDMKERG